MDIQMRYYSPILLSGIIFLKCDIFKNIIYIPYIVQNSCYISSPIVSMNEHECDICVIYAENALV